MRSSEWNRLGKPVCRCQMTEANETNKISVTDQFHQSSCLLSDCSTAFSLPSLGVLSVCSTSNNASQITPLDSCRTLRLVLN